MSTTPVTPEVAPDPFKGETPTLEEYNLFRSKGELPERFKEPPVAEAKTEEGKEPPKTEQETGAERDEHGKFKAKEPLFTAEQQEAFDRAFRKREAKIRREYEEKLAAKESESKGTAPEKEPEEPAAEPKRPELPKLSEYQGTIEEFDKEVAEYPAKLAAFLDAQRQSKERGLSIQKKLNDSEKAAIKAHSDYQDEFNKLKEEVAAGEEIGLPDHVIKAIAEEADDPYEVTYHLMKNRDELRRFASLDEASAKRAVNRLDERLSIKSVETPAPPKKTVTKAADKYVPPEPVGARATATEFDVNDESLTPEQWREKREAQLAKKRGR